MRLGDSLNLRCLGWGDMLTTGIDERQLRGAIDRGLIPLGEKGVHGRLIFSPAERFAVQLMRELARIWMPVSKAAFVTQSVRSSLEPLLNYQRGVGAQTRGEGKIVLRITSESQGDTAWDYAIGTQKYRPGRGVEGHAPELKTFISVDLDQLLNDFLVYFDALSRSQRGEVL